MSTMFCDNCGVLVEEADRTYVSSLPVAIASANAGESAVLCAACSERLAELPQVYVSVVGGIADAVSTRGNVDVVIIDWDVFEDNVPDSEELADLQASVDAIAEPHRAAVQRELDAKLEKLAKWKRWTEEESQRRRALRIADARNVLREEGELA
jgi:hypothetical protein